MPKKRVPIKNIEPILIDVKKPGVNYGRVSETKKINLSRVPQAPFRPKRFKKAASFSILIVFIVVFSSAAWLFWSFKSAKVTLTRSGEEIAGNFFSAVHALKDVRPEEAGALLKKNSNELTNLESILKKNPNKFLMSGIGLFVPIIKEAGSFLEEISSFNSDFIRFSDQLADLQSSGFTYFQTDGEKFTGGLKNLKGGVLKIIGEMQKIKNTTASLKNISPFFNRFDSALGEKYLKYSSDLRMFDKFLERFVALIDSPEEKHILLLFQNPAEIRPGGGFIGSYGDLVVKFGQMVNLEVQDIYWPDHPINFDLKVVPPEPLQGVTTNWGARDANWFFDFPVSAKTVSAFLENSKIYKEKNIRFEGVVALNINVLENILGLTGPIKIEEYGLEINKDNFLNEIQREVEAGRDKKPGQNPKKILSVLTPILLERLNNFDDEAKKELIGGFGERFAKKDIMVNAVDPELNSLFSALGVDGAVYALPNDFWGSYLAIVNANVAGGKSDAFIEQMVEGKVDIDTDGGIFTDLTIKRRHFGEKEKDPWWRATNKDFIQIFMNPGSSIVSLKGQNTRSKQTKVDYQTLGYERNADLETIESTKTFLNDFQAWTMKAFGKTVFATWFDTPAGETKILSFKYQTQPADKQAVETGKIFKFVFEKQSGVKGDLKFEIRAPLGYIWKESESPVFVYENEDVKSRIILSLTLAKTRLEK